MQLASKREGEPRFAHTPQSTIQDSNSLFAYAYQRMREQMYDVSVCSQRNFQELLQTFRQNSFLPPAEQEWYRHNGLGNEGEPLLLPKELELRTTWYEKIVPLMTLKHSATRIDFTELKPLAMREREADVTTVNNTGRNALNEFSFFVLGVGDHHCTPSFLDANTETILIRIGQLSVAEQEKFLGLWFGNQMSSQREAMVSFGGTKRLVEFDGKKRTKTYTYERSNGIKITRCVKEEQEIFAAEHTLQTIWDSLFYLFILELRSISGDFQQYVLSNASDQAIIGHIYNSLFHSWVFPEIKVPQNIPLINQPGIEVQRQSSDFLKKAEQWFRAANEGNLTVLQQFVTQRWSLDLTTSMHETALLLATKKNKTEAAKYLLSCGADMTIRDALRRQAFHLAIEQGNNDLIYFMARGIPDPIISTIIRFPVLNPLYLNDYCVLELVLRAKRLDLFQFFLSQGAKITPDLPIILWLYENNFKTETVHFLSQSSVNTKSLKGITALMCAAERGDEAFVRQLILAGADVNARVVSQIQNDSPQEGQTPLFFAAQEGHIQVMALLLHHNADPKLTDVYDRTVYDIVSLPLRAGLEGYLQEHAVELRASLSVALQDGGTIAREGFNIQLHLAQIRWEEREKKLTAARDFLIERKLAPQDLNLYPIIFPKRMVAGVAVITGRIQGEPHVLMIQASSAQAQKPRGFYRFPGGLKESSDPDLKTTALRELEEETGMKLSDTLPIIPFYTYQEHDIAAETAKEIHFYHCDVGDDLVRYVVFPRSEVARAFYLNITRVTYNSETKGFYYEGVRIEQSNALILQALQQNVVVPVHALSQCVMIQRTPMATVMDAVQQGNFIWLKELSQKGFCFEELPILLPAMLNNNQALFDALIQMGADVNFIYPNAKLPTLLMCAVFAGSNDWVKKLVESYRCDVNVYSQSMSALIVASNCNRAMMRYLLEHGAKCDRVSGGQVLLGLMRNRQSSNPDITEEERLELARGCLDRFKIDLNCTYKMFPLDFSFAPTPYPIWFAVEGAISGFCPVAFVQLLFEKGASPLVTRNGVFETWTLPRYLLHQFNKYKNDMKNISMYRDFIVRRENARSNPEKYSYGRIGLFGSSEEECIQRIEQDLPNIDAIRTIMQLFDDVIQQHPAATPSLRVLPAARHGLSQ